MSAVFLFSLLAGVFNAGNDLVFKKSSKGSKNDILSFYLVASLSSACIAILLSVLSGDISKALLPANILYGLLVGVLSFFIYLFYILSFTGNSTPVPVTIYRLNLIPGVVLAVLLLGETLSLIRYIAIALSIISIVLLTGIKPGTKLTRQDMKPLLYSLAACLLGGILNVANKAAVIHGADAINLSLWRFLVVIFCTVIYMALGRKLSVKKSTVMPGILSGALLLGALYATLEAFKSGDVAFVIPVAQILTIVLVSAVSWTLLKETVSRWKLMGILSAILAVIFINL